MIKIFLDDVRPAPDDTWILCSDPDEVISLLQREDVTEISLDHDLGDELLHDKDYCNSVKEKTGYDVLLWIEAQVITTNYIPPKISIHTSNPAARKRMEACLCKIKGEVIKRRQEKK
jgi:hypothetical protein